jgi:ADP-ribose pyrophosphatase YjhB (NUDIX family)
MTGPLPKEEFDWIFSRVPRLTVEVVIAGPENGVLLQLRDIEPCKGTWSLPGGTVRFGEPLVDAVRRVARDELKLVVSVGEMLGYIEYPSHYKNGLDSPVGIAFVATAAEPASWPRNCDWFTTLPDNMHDEQKAFLARHLGLSLGSVRGRRTRLVK